MSLDLRLHGQVKPWRALAAWAAATLVVALIAWAATNAIGLPGWVLPGSLAVMLATLAMKASPRMSWRRTWMCGALAVGAFAALVVAFMAMRAFGIGPAGSLIGAHKLSPSERLVIADFKGPAADSTLGRTITEALRADLDQSSALHVVSRQTMNETLGLMRKPPSTFVDVDIGRELATREGIKAVLDGEVVARGERYVLSARLVSPQSGEEMASFREEATSRGDLIPAVGQLATQLRSKVGESLQAIREASPLDRVTTSSIDALSKYAGAAAVLDQTGDYRRAIPLLEQAVALDSTFAMAWRRLGSAFSESGQRDSAARAVSHAYAYRDRLSETERALTIATYYAIGPQVDEERALEAYENVLTRDSSNIAALNNAALILVRRRDFERAEAYALRATAQNKAIPNPIAWGNAVAWSLPARDLTWTDSIMHVWASRAPDQPSQLLWQARVTTFGHRDYDAGEQIYASMRPRIDSSRATTDTAMLDQSALMFLRGRLREGFQVGNQVRTSQFERGVSMAPLESAIDSALIISLVERNGPLARAVLLKARERSALDSVSLVDRPYQEILDVLATTGDSSGVAQARSDLQHALVAQGKTLDRPALEAFADGQVDFAAGRFGQAIAKFNEAERHRHPCAECTQAWLFLAFDRLGQTDSAIAAGEAFLKTARIEISMNDAAYRARILLRLGELYESKQVPYKAVQRYQEFVDLWQKADAELQPRVRDVGRRLERLRAEIVRKG